MDSKRKSVYSEILNYIKSINSFEEGADNQKVIDLIKSAHNKVSTLRPEDFEDEFDFNQHKFLLNNGLKFRDFLIKNLSEDSDSTFQKDGFFIAKLELLSIQNSLILMPWEVDN